MRHRFETIVGNIPGLQHVQVRPCSALKAVWSEGYHGKDLRADIMAGLVVGIVALPLSMALAIASGVPPQHGLYTAIIAGGLIAVLGGSRVQVSGPTAAFVVILAPISAKFGLAGLAIATVMAGLILMLMGVLRMGRLIEFIPNPVTIGFTAGIAVTIATLQLKDFFGLSFPAFDPEANYLEKVHVIGHAMLHHDWLHHWHDLFIGALTLAMLIGWSKFTKRIPAALIALSTAAILGYALHRAWPWFEIVTIQSKFGSAANPYGIPQLPPLPIMPWNEPGPGGEQLRLSLGLIQELVPYAFAIAMLGAIESLLSAVVADGMTGKKHDPDAELLAQGTGNVIAPFFGGFAATGAIARTATGIRAGARSPIASIVHALFVLAAVLLLAPLLGYLPMASMAALLLVVAWNMSEAKHFFHTIKVAPRSDVLVLLCCFGLTVLFDMAIAVSAGVILAALLFMQRMAALSGAKLIGDHHPTLDESLPKNLLVYEVRGPLFFGAAQRAMSQLQQISKDVKVVVMDLSDVPVMDATGLTNLESAVDKLYRSGVHVVIAGVQDQPAQVLAKAQWQQGDGRIEIFRSFNQGLATARALVQLL